MTLRPLLNEDIQDIFTLRSDREVNRYLDREASVSLEDAKRFINKIWNGYNKDHFFLLGHNNNGY